jgi:hypothetical protein
MNSIEDSKLTDEIINEVLSYYKCNPNENNFNSKKYKFSGLYIDVFAKNLVSQISNILKKENPNFFVCLIPSSPNEFTIGCIKNRTVPASLNGGSYNGIFSHEWIDLSKKIPKLYSDLSKNSFQLKYEKE